MSPALKQWMNLEVVFRAAVAAAMLTTGVMTAVSSRTAQGAASTPLMVTDTNDVMNGAMPTMPKFPKLAKKAGYLRGYVKDSEGNPISGASVMITAPVIWGMSLSRNSITVKSNADGLYEVKIPTGGCRVWCAGHAVTYNGVRLALPLHPADGEYDPSLPLKEGAVENLVLLPYGVATASSVSENPVYCGGYYGASFTVGYMLREPKDTFSPQHWIEEGSQIEISLTPEGPLLGGTPSRPLVIRKKLSGSYFQVNNIPIGRYRIRTRLLTSAGSEPLRLSENGGSPRKGGMEPKETDGAASIVFRSNSGDPATLRVPGGSMERLELFVQRKRTAP